MALPPDAAAVAILAGATDLTPVCGHVESGFTVTRIVDSVPTVICQPCFAAVVHEDVAARLAANPIVADLECLMCGNLGARMNADLGAGVCDACMHTNLGAIRAAEARHVPRDDIVPDEVSRDALFIGQKEAAFNRDTLRRLGITRVLVCCEQLPAYHFPHDPTVKYHRLPIQDSLAQQLDKYLPSGLAFIAQGVQRGEKVLVHCNAGVSRSGSVAVEWLRRTVPALGGDFDAALAAAKACRPIITPNTNFVVQLRAIAALPPPSASGELPVAAPAAAAAGAPDAREQ